MAEFTTLEAFLKACERVRDAGYKSTDAYSPFPVEETMHALGKPHSKIPRLIFAGGLTGFSFGFALQYFTSVIDYPISIAGRPLFSWPSFIPICFECTVLFSAFMAVLGMIFLNGLPKHYHPVFNVKEFADAEEMAAILDTPYEISDKNIEILGDVKGEIVFDQVTYIYSNNNSKVLDNFSLEIPAGQKIAIIGSSGSGKTTFVRLLLRLFNLLSGCILIDGVDISNISQKNLRENISFVPQDPVLFHRTLMENIRYGKRDASDEEVFHAARLAHCDEFIQDLPEGYQTYVGERGVKLSGGERQRIAIARAILKNAPILILDEATSALDSQSEHLIQDALHNLIKGKTTIVIAHRLSTIREMDRIIVLQKGKIIEDGKHEDLLKKDGGLYQQLWNLQAGGFKNII
jgi:ATP-binding cassette subfamily B protein